MKKIALLLLMLAPLLSKAGALSADSATTVNIPLIAKVVLVIIIGVVALSAVRSYSRQED